MKVPELSYPTGHVVNLDPSKGKGVKTHPVLILFPPRSGLGQQLEALRNFSPRFGTKRK